MRHRSSGQSIVEMAFVLPALLLVVFGIMEFGYIVYAYSTVSQAARNAAEAASGLPPYPTWLAYKSAPSLPANYPGFTADRCVYAIYKAAESDATLFKGDITNDLRISYPQATGTDDTRNLEDRGPIEVTINYRVAGITPLFKLLRIGDSDGKITLSVTQRRSIESLGVDPTKPGNQPCAKDIADYYTINP